MERGVLSSGCLRWAGTRIDKWESSCRRTTRIIPHSTRGSTIPFHTSNAFHTACRVRLGGEGDGNGDWPPLFWAPPSVFAHFEFYFSKLSITMNSISHPNSMDFPPLVVVVKRGDLTKWDIEQVFGTITCLLNTPTPNLPHPPPNTEISFHGHHRASLLDQHLILAHLPYLPSRP